MVYILDGYWDAPLANSIYPHLIYDKVIPECIMVGIGYAGDNPDVESLRKVDLAPPTPDSVENENDFLSRLEKHVIPFVESEFAADPTFRCITVTSDLQKPQLVPFLKINANIADHAINATVEHRPTILRRKYKMIHQNAYIITLVDVIATHQSIITNLKPKLASGY